MVFFQPFCVVEKPAFLGLGPNPTLLNLHGLDQRVPRGGRKLSLFRAGSLHIHQFVEGSPQQKVLINRPVILERGRGRRQSNHRLEWDLMG